jgi:hypothetical protein
VRVGEHLREHLRLVGRGLLDLQGAFASRLTLEGLPVTGDLEDGEHRLGGLRADRQPVLHPRRVDADEAGLLLGVVEPDLLDGPTVPLRARVGDDDAVLGVADLAHPLQLDLDGHVGWYSSS